MSKSFKPLRLIFSLFLIWVEIFGVSAGAAPVPGEKSKTLLISGIEQGLNLREEEAFAELNKAISIDPPNALAHSFLTMAYLFFYETSFTEKEKKEKEEALSNTLAKAQKVAQEKIMGSPQEAEGYLALAISKMVKTRYELLQKNYLRAFREGPAIWETLAKVRELDAQNYEVYYLSGLWHYHLAQLPGIAGWLSSLFITPGDPQKGIQELEVAAAKAFYTRDLARANLVSIYSGYEKKYEQALPIAQILKNKYPRNYNFAFALANIYSELQQFAAALSLAKEIEQNIKDQHPPYRPELWPRYYQLLGKIYFDQGHYDRARQYFNLALKDESFYNARVRAWALVRLGMIHDVQKQRNLAEEYYQKALEVEGAEGLAQRTAREYLKTPYNRGGKK